MLITELATTWADPTATKHGCCFSHRMLWCMLPPTMRCKLRPTCRAVQYCHAKIVAKLAGSAPVGLIGMIMSAQSTQNKSGSCAKEWLDREGWTCSRFDSAAWKSASRCAAMASFVVAPSRANV